MSSSPTTLAFLEFSQLAYDLTSTSGLATVPIPSGFTELMQSPAYPSGMTAVVFMNQATNQIVISFRGSTLDAFYDDWISADLLGIAAGTVPQAFGDALLFAQTVQQAYPGSTIYVTGHSLGGAEAEYVAATLDAATGAQNSISGITFAAPAISSLLPVGVPYASVPLVNYVNTLDPIGNFIATTVGATTQGAHVGSTIELPLPVDFSNVFTAGLLVLGSAALAATYHPLGAYASALLKLGYINTDPIAQSASSSEPIDLATIYPTIQNVANGTAADGMATQSGTVTVSTSVGNISIFVAEAASPSGGLGFSSSILTANNTLSQTTSFNADGNLVSDSTTLDGMIVQSPTLDPASINVSSSGAILIGIPSQQQGDEVTLVANPDGSEAVDIGGDSSSSIQTAVDFAAGGTTGDTLTVSDTSCGDVDLSVTIQNGDTSQVSSDASLVDVSQDFDFAGSSGTLLLENPSTFSGTISNFVAGDTIDLVGVSATGATLNTSGTTLNVELNGGGTLALNVASVQSNQGFAAISDGAGGSDIVVGTLVGDYLITSLSDPDAIPEEGGGVEEYATFPVGINDSGTIVGNATGAGGFIYINGQFESLNDPNSLPTSVIPFYGTDVSGISNNGVIAGTFSYSSSDAEPLFTEAAFIYNNGSFTTINFPYGANGPVFDVGGINDSETFVGQDFDPGQEPFIYQNGTHGESGPGAYYTAINDAGIVLGSYGDGFFLYDTEDDRIIAGFPEIGYGISLDAINNGDTVAGAEYTVSGYSGLIEGSSLFGVGGIRVRQVVRDQVFR